MRSSVVGIVLCGVRTMFLGMKLESQDTRHIFEPLNGSKNLDICGVTVSDCQPHRWIILNPSNIEVTQGLGAPQIEFSDGSVIA